MNILQERHIILDEFDDERNAVINPWENFRQMEGFPEILVTTFTKSIVDKWAGMEGTRKAGGSFGANGEQPVYETDYRGQKIGFCMAPVGAPACIGLMEDFIAMGAKYIVMFGSCGALDKEIADGHMVIPSSAVRDEGTSYHYAAASDEIEMDADAVRILTETMEELQYPYVVGKTWSTDAFYRETRAKIERRKAAGCIVVEMECSAMIAMTRLRGVKFAQFIYAADNLDSAVWEQRGLHEHQGLSRSDMYMEVAMEAGLKLKHAAEGGGKQENIEKV